MPMDNPLCLQPYLAQQPDQRQAGSQGVHQLVPGPARADQQVQVGGGEGQEVIHAPRIT